MRVVIQRSRESSVKVEGNLINKINKGLVVLVGITNTDTIEDINYLVKKIVNLRIFEDEKGIMNKSIKDIEGEILSISQFTLYALTNNGNRPSYIKAAKKEIALPLYEKFNEELNEDIKTYPGVFGADMKLSIQNDGPVTIIIDSEER